MTEGNDFQKVIWAIEDRFYEEGLLSKKSQIADWTGLSPTRVDSIIENLEGSEEIFRIYEAPGDPIVYLTKEMKNSLTAQASEPDWIREYEFDEKRDLMEEVKEGNERISDIQKIERLLYGTGDLLEDSVEHTLNYLGFEADSTEEYEDFCIEQDEHVYVIEVKGVEGQVKKEDVDQLGDWLHKKIDEGVKASNLTGLLLYNHELHLEPEERGDPMTESAIQFLEHQRSKHIQTKSLFDIVKQVKSGDMEKSTARTKFLEGDDNDH